MLSTLESPACALVAVFDLVDKGLDTLLEFARLARYPVSLRSSRYAARDDGLLLRLELPVASLVIAQRLASPALMFHGDT